MYYVEEHRTKAMLSAPGGAFAASCQLWMLRDKGSCCNGEQCDMCNGVEILSGLSASDPQAFLCGIFKSGIVTLTLSSQGVDILEGNGIPLNGKPIIIRNRHIFSATCSFRFFVKTLVVTGAVMQMRSTLVWAAEFLSGSSSVREFSVFPHR